MRLLVGVRAVALAAAVLSAACGDKASRAPLTVASLASGAVGTSLYIAPEPSISNVEDAEGKALASTLLSELRRTLMEAGFRLVDTKEAAGGVTAVLSIATAGRVHGDLFINDPRLSRVRLSIEQGGALLGESNAETVSTSSTYGPSASDAAIQLTNGISQSARLVAALTSNRQASPSAIPPPVSAARSGAASLVTGAPQRTAYALVIGIERYRDLPPPPGARADADAFANLLRTTLGLPEANVRLALDDRATKTDLERQLAWLKANVPAGGRVYFFFSGHGAPDAAKGTSYLVPYDGDAQAIEQTSIPLDKVLAELGETKAKETMAFVDACFSGAGGRSVLPKGARPLVKLKEVSGPKAVAVFSASSGTQISGPSQDGKNGAFTRYLIEAIGEAKADINGDGQLTLQELAEWVTPRVEREAKQQSRDQTPKLVVGGKVGNPKDVAVAWGLK